MEIVVKRIALWSGIILLVLFTTQRIFFFKTGFLEHASSFLTAPILRASSYVTAPFKHFLTQKKRQHGAYARAEEMYKNYRDLIDENIQLAATLERYQNIKELVEFQKRYDLENAITSKVLLKNFTDSSHAIILDKGTRDGIRKDMVAVHTTQLIGRVTEVYYSHCKVMLITDSGCKVAAHTSQSKAHGIVVGTNTSNECSLSYVSHLQPIADNDLVISSGEGLVFPEGLCLGRIAQHTKDGLCHTIKVSPLIDFTNLEFCVLLDRDSTPHF